MKKRTFILIIIPLSIFFYPLVRNILTMRKLETSIEKPKEYISLFKKDFQRKIKTINTFKLKDPDSNIFADFYIDSIAGFAVFKVTDSCNFYDIHYIVGKDINFGGTKIRFDIINAEFSFSRNFPTLTNIIHITTNEEIEKTLISKNILLLKYNTVEMSIDFNKEKTKGIYIGDGGFLKENYIIELALVKKNGYIYFIFFEPSNLTEKKYELLDFINISDSI